MAALGQSLKTLLRTSARVTACVSGCVARRICFDFGAGPDMMQRHCFLLRFTYDLESFLCFRRQARLWSRDHSWKPSFTSERVQCVLQIAGLATLIAFGLNVEACAKGRHWQASALEFGCAFGASVVHYTARS